MNEVIAVLLGASKYPEHSDLDSKSFANSSAGFLRYLKQVLRLSDECILNLFDRPETHTQLDAELGKFLEAHSKATDVLIHYVGHGSFVGTNKDYVLALKATRKRAVAASSYRVADLAHTLKEFAVSLRRYLILDCCFAAATIKEFQASSATAVMIEKTEEVLPRAGTALLCASGATTPAETRHGDDLTMFSDSFLHVLNHGAKGRPTVLTLEEVGDLTRQRIQERFPTDGVRPQVQVPLQDHGNIARDVRLFPNVAVGASAQVLQGPSVKSAGRPRRYLVFGGTLWVAVSLAAVIYVYRPNLPKVTDPEQSDLKTMFRRVPCGAPKPEECPLEASLQERVTALKRYVESCRKRGANPDLTSIDLRDAVLIGLDLSKVNFTGADLSGATMAKVDLRDATLSSSRLVRTNLIRARINRTSFNGADLHGAMLGNAEFDAGSTFIHANLCGVWVPESARRLPGFRTYGVRDTICPDGTKQDDCLGHWGPPSKAKVVISHLSGEDISYEQWEFEDLDSDCPARIAK